MTGNLQFDLLVLTPPNDPPGEADALLRMVDAGLQWVHVRKPAHKPHELARWLEALPSSLRARGILHGHPTLVQPYGLAGWHERDGIKNVSHTIPPGLHSRALHSAEAVHRSLNQYDRILFAPVFPSISKPDHGPASPEKVESVSTILRQNPLQTRRARVFALGGIAPERLQAVADWGFDGAALLGAIWLSPDPVAAFQSFQNRPITSPVFS